MKFECDKCGACCKNIRLSRWAKDLDRGDGVCKHLTAENLCEIYAERPIFCNVEAYYDEYFSDVMSREKFYKINYDACKRLKKFDSAKKS